MKQLSQDSKSGDLAVLEVPQPALRPGCLLVRTRRSVVSPGTERAAVSMGRDSYLKTARNRPDLVRRVTETVRREGVLSAYRKVQSKLAEPKALGYSSAGDVIGVGRGAEGRFHVGDRVACAGLGIASHAEIVCVPVNLAARIPDGVSYDDAAFATLGAIAMHGLRQAEPTLGESFAVIGLGLVGQLTVQLLNANGVRVAGFDLDPQMVDRARQAGAETGSAGSIDEQFEVAMAWTNGRGVDGVIVTAASSSDAPMVAAAKMARDRGRVVAVGFVPFGLPRDLAFEKELELKISRSYGPGRYDPDFEDKGQDYPIGYVRWTETRNLETFLRLVAGQRLRLDELVTHRFSLTDAPAAYRDLLGSGAGGQRPLGMVIEYADPADNPVVSGASVAPTPVESGEGTLGVAFVGAGSFARGTLLPHFKGGDGLRLRRVVASTGLSAENTQRRFGFEECGTDPASVFEDPAVQLVCIATRHDSHADLTCSALEAGKHVFVEKPLALDEQQLERVAAASRGARGLLMVGYNRRFSPMARAIRRHVTDRGPVAMLYRVNAGQLPPRHWANDPDVGGGRLIGEGCHFVDLLSFLTGDSPIVAVRSRRVGRSRMPETFVIQLGFADGSAGQILYTAAGNPRLSKEYLEVHGGGVSAVLDDYRRCTIFDGSKRERIRQSGKGHAEEIATLLHAIRRGGAPPIPLEAMLGVSRATLEAQRRFSESNVP